MGEGPRTAASALTVPELRLRVVARAGLDVSLPSPDRLDKADGIGRFDAITIWGRGWAAGSLTDAELAERIGGGAGAPVPLAWHQAEPPGYGQPPVGRN
jgi:hypothetical protein